MQRVVTKNQRIIFSRPERPADGTKAEIIDRKVGIVIGDGGKNVIFVSKVAQVLAER